MTRSEAMAAVKRNPTDPHAWLDLGATLAIEGATQEAKECYERALRLDPTLDEAQAALQSFAPTPEPAPPARPPEPSPDDPPLAPSVPPDEASHPDWLLAMRERATDMPTEEEEPDLFDPEIALDGEEVSDDTVLPEERTDWMHNMRERIGDEPPPPTGSGRVNKRRLLIVIALLTLCSFASCVGASRFFSNFRGAGSSEGNVAETVVPPPLPTESPTLVATWTPRPTSTPRPTPPARPTRTPLPALTATLEPTAAAQQAYLDFLTEVQNQYTPALQELRELVATARDNPALLDDSQWRLDMSRNIALVQFVNRKIFEQAAPESLQPFHQELTSAAQSYESAMSTFESAIESRSLDQLNEADQVMSQATLAISRLSLP